MAQQAAEMAVPSESQVEPQEESVHLSELDQQEIARLAYEFWEARGCPHGSPEEDWLRAERDLQRRKAHGPRRNGYRLAIEGTGQEYVCEFTRIHNETG